MGSFNQFGEEIIKIPRFKTEFGFNATKRSSELMKKIKSKHTKCEIKFRKAIWRLGYRYRINVKSLEGKPDMVFKKQKIVVFIDGSFWHGHNWDKRKDKIKSNRGYWTAKIERNIQRDKEVTFALERKGWTVIRFWEHDIEKAFDNCADQLRSALNRDGKYISVNNSKIFAPEIAS